MNFWLLKEFTGVKTQALKNWLIENGTLTPNGWVIASNKNSAVIGKIISSLSAVPCDVTLVPVPKAGSGEAASPC